MASVGSFCVLGIILFICVIETRAVSEYCFTRSFTWDFCDYGCCETKSFYKTCCEKNDGKKDSDSGLVVGSVLAGVAGVFVVVGLIAVICCCCAANSKRGPSARVVHPAVARYDGATVHVFYTGGSAGLQLNHQPVVAGAQPLKPPPYKREPDPSPPSYSSLGHGSKAPFGVVTVTALERQGSSTVLTAPRGWSTASQGASLTPLEADQFFPEDLRALSPPPPYFAAPDLPSEPVSGAPAPQSTVYPAL